MMTSSPLVNLEIFEGPLDLLLHLIKKDDINIYDIPITPILNQYMDYLELMHELNIDLAGDFIFMASELSHIKSRYLLMQQGSADTQEEPDPRNDLVARLLEYQQYKRAAQWLTNQPLLDWDVHKRPKMILPKEFRHEEPTLDIEPFALLSAFQEVLKKAPKQTVHEIEAERVSVTERIYQIMDQLKNQESLHFEELFSQGVDRSQLIVTFLAILEMGRLKMIRIFQMDPFGPILIRRTMQQIEEGIGGEQIYENNPIKTDS